MGRMANVPDLPPLAVGAQQAAAMLGISDRKLWSMTQAGEIPHVRLGGRVLYRVRTLDAWLAERETAGMAEAEVEGGAE